MTDVHLFGIRHHGPGSARSTLIALQQLKPDLVLVEGPPDAEAVLPLLMHKDMTPPVALLIYAEDNPAQASYYPFMVFSPEYQAIHYAYSRGIPVHFMDLPQKYAFALRPPTPPSESSDTDEKKAQPVEPLAELARAAGYEDAERWWDAMVEQRQDSHAVFEAIAEAMTALREILPHTDPMETLREAHMRRTIHQAQQKGVRRIAVVCGAWHVPALHNTPYTAEDEQRLSALQEIRVAATWVPWTYTRLSRYSGYGAGVESPGWYRFLWDTPNAKMIAPGWLTKVAQTLRKHGLDASTAQIIDAVRLVEVTSTLRGRALPDLHDLNEAVLSVLCHGNEAPMQVIARDVIIGHEMGSVPASAPTVPLQRDFMLTAARLGLPLSEEETDQVLDLRVERDREVSRLLYRMHLLEIPWGAREDSDLMYEAWVLKWDAALVIRLIERSAWGNTVVEAATGYALHRAYETQSLAQLTQLVEDVLLADLPLAISEVVAQLEHEAATTGDIAQLMAALPPLANTLTYGDVRRTSTEAIRRVVDSMIVRIIIGLPAECIALDDEAAGELLQSVIACDSALQLLHESEILHNWHTTLARMVDQNGVHGLLRGRFCRIVLDAEVMSKEEAVRHMRLALARVVMAEEAAAWLHGFLQDSGILLVHDETLLEVVDEWVCSLTIDEFDRILPLIRRIFASFEEPEIHHIGRRISGKPLKKPAPPPAINPERAKHIDALLTDLLGLKGEPSDDRPS